MCVRVCLCVCASVGLYEIRTWHVLPCAYMCVFVQEYVCAQCACVYGGVRLDVLMDVLRGSFEFKEKNALLAPV